MAMNDFKKKKKCGSCSGFRTFQFVGIILMAFGVTTLCAFLLPIKVWVMLLAVVLLFCGILLFYD